MEIKNFQDYAPHHFSWGMVKKAVANCEKAKRKEGTYSILSLGNASMHDHDQITNMYNLYILFSTLIFISIPLVNKIIKF